MSGHHKIIAALTLLGLAGASGATAQPLPPRDAEIRRHQEEHYRADERSIEAHRRWDARHHRYIYDPGYYPPPPPVVVAQPMYVAPQPAYVVPAQPAYIAPAPASGVNLDLHFR